MIAAAAVLVSSGAAADALRFVAAPEPDVDVIVDSRAAARCGEASLPGARCLSITDVLGPHDRFPSVSGLLWLLGTAGLTGAEHVLVIGERALDRDALAGVLYLAGQRRVSVLARRFSQAFARDAASAPGVARRTTREVVFQAPMRARSLVLRRELLALIRSPDPPVILDGRSEAEYWGEAVRAARGGRLPGAQHSPLSQWAAGAEAPVAVAAGAGPVVYGRGARDGLAFTARVAALGIEPRVYLEGWAGWASDGSLPADGVTYPDHPPATGRVAKPAPAPGPGWALPSAFALAGALVAGACFALGRRSALRRLG
jgi:thiosulfate/3-mercaptopyruvate sulfurtransferase